MGSVGDSFERDRPEAHESPPLFDHPKPGERRAAGGGPHWPTEEAPEPGLPGDELADAEHVVDEALGEAPGPSDEPRDALVAERDEYREALMRIKADFDNYKKRVAKDHAATVERAAERLVSDLLPVLDACEAALGHGAQDVDPIHKSLLDVLEKSGLARMAPEHQPFDPNLHEAVLHEPSEEGESQTIVVGSLRTGYLWNGRVIRPAMVKVKG